MHQNRAKLRLLMSYISLMRLQGMDKANQALCLQLLTLSIPPYPGMGSQQGLKVNNTWGTTGRNLVFSSLIAWAAKYCEQRQLSHSTASLVTGESSALNSEGYSWGERHSGMDRDAISVFIAISETVKIPTAPISNWIVNAFLRLQYYLKIQSWPLASPIFICIYPLHKSAMLLYTLKKLPIYIPIAAVNSAVSDVQQRTCKPLHHVLQRTLFLSPNTCLQLCQWRNQLASSISNFFDSKSTNTDLF